MWPVLLVQLFHSVNETFPRIVRENFYYVQVLTYMGGFSSYNYAFQLSQLIYQLNYFICKNMICFLILNKNEVEISIDYLIISNNQLSRLINHALFLKLFQETFAKIFTFIYVFLLKLWLTISIKTNFVVYKLS